MIVWHVQAFANYMACPSVGAIEALCLLITIELLKVLTDTSENIQLGLIIDVLIIKECLINIVAILICDELSKSLLCQQLLDNTGRASFSLKNPLDHSDTSLIDSYLCSMQANYLTHMTQALFLLKKLQDLHPLLDDPVALHVCAGGNDNIIHKKVCL